MTEWPLLPYGLREESVSQLLFERHRIELVVGDNNYFIAPSLFEKVL
jgi:hypothetical protein